MLVQYLYNTKKVTLQGIGTITLDPSVPLPLGNEKEKDIIMPENAFQFKFNPKETEDSELVKYIVQHTGKMFPLASSDLDSYVTLAKQFLNIGKPLVIEGVGTIQKMQQGDYQFIQGHFITPKMDDFPNQLRKKRDGNISFESLTKINYSRRNIQFAAAVFIIILISLAAYYLLRENLMDATIVPAEETKIVDSIKPKVIDSISMASIAEQKKDNYNFKIIIKRYHTAEAVKIVYNRLSSYGHHLIIFKLDSVNYELAIPFKTPLSDTLRAKDSLREFFGGAPYVKF